MSTRKRWRLVTKPPYTRVYCTSRADAMRKVAGLVQDRRLGLTRAETVDVLVAEAPGAWNVAEHIRLDEVDSA